MIRSYRMRQRPHVVLHAWARSWTRPNTWLGIFHSAIPGLRGRNIVLLQWRHIPLLPCPPSQRISRGSGPIRILILPTHLWTVRCRGWRSATRHASYRGRDRRCADDCWLWAPVTSPGGRWLVPDGLGLQVRTVGYTPRKQGVDDCSRSASYPSFQ